MVDVPEKEKRIRILAITQEGFAQSIENNLAEHQDEVEFIGNSKTGEQGIRQAQLLSPDVVLIDAYTPDMNPIEVVSALRQSNANLHIITSSLPNDPHWIMASIEAGANDCISQPLSSDDLYQLIHRLYHRTGPSLRDQHNERKKRSQSQLQS